MRTTFFASALAVALIAAAGCGVGSDEEDWVAIRVHELSVESSGEPVPLCRWVEETVRDRKAAIYAVRGSDEFVALSMGGRTLCVDVAYEVYLAGITPVADASEKPCAMCAGTPLPADKFIEIVKRSQQYLEQMGMVR